MELKHPRARSSPFRFFGYGCLALLALAEAVSGTASAGPWALCGFALVWPWVAHRAPAADRLETALVLHVTECLVVGLLLTTLSLLPAVSVAVALLAGPAALGGIGFLAPAAAALVLGLYLSSPGTLLSWEDLLALALLFGFALAQSLVSFRQAQRLYRGRGVAVDESAALRKDNARLARYLPAAVVQGMPGLRGQRQPPEQRWISVVFVDVVGFTRLVSNGSAAETADVVNDYQAALSELVADSNCVLGKFLGDGALIYTSIDNRAEGAASCARLTLRLPRMLTRLARNWRQRGQLVELECHAGIASGYCAIGDWGGAGRLDHTIIGDTVNLASRLQDAATSEGVLVSAATAALLDSQAEFSAGTTGPFTLCLKGLGDVAVYRLHQ